VGEDRDEAVPGTDRRRRPPSRRTLVIVVTILIAFTIAGTLANIFLAPLRRDHPLVVLLLDARNRQLLLVSNRMGTPAFVSVGVIRRMAADPLYYLLGYWYGERAVRWMEAKLGSGGGVVRAVERIFARAAPVMVFFFPGAPVCVLAGAAGMSPVVFALCNAAGTVSIVVGLRVFSDALSGPIDSLTSFVDHNAKWLALAAVVATLFLFWQQRRSGTGELQALTDLANDVTDPEANPDRPSDRSDDRSP
jgi:membrane protein DedA with SNARE-associated domain